MGKAREKGSMTPNHETLRHAGVALYGQLWQSALAEALDINLRTMQRWAAGTNAINPNIWQEIAKLCRSRDKALAKLADQVTISS